MVCPCLMYGIYELYGVHARLMHNKQCAMWQWEQASIVTRAPLEACHVYSMSALIASGKRPFRRQIETGASTPILYVPPYQCIVISMTLCASATQVAWMYWWCASFQHKGTRRGISVCVMQVENQTIRILLSGPPNTSPASSHYRPPN